MSGRRAERVPRVVVITGLSGSGKSTATRAFEDIGWFCVDNLPALLLPRIVDLVSAARGEEARIAFVADVRGREFLPGVTKGIGELRQGGRSVHILFLDAPDEVLLRRFSETRRNHPLAGKGGTRGAIRRERELLRPLREAADTVLDTGGYTVHELREAVMRRFGGTGRTMRVGILSFGYRYGVPPEADMVVDVRFLPNPNFVPSLKRLTGADPRVREYLTRHRITDRFLGRLAAFLKFLLPLYRKEGKAYFTVAVGCTGGRHRSVAVAELLAGALPGGVAPTVSHRDIGREPVSRGARG